MQYLKRIWQIITKDVNNDNELKKPSVIIRCTALAMILYSIVNAVMMIRLKLTVPFFICLAFAAAFGLMFYLAYHDITKECYFLEMFLILVWVVLSVKLFGWSIGAQYFIFLLIQYCFVTSHIGKLYKYLICSLFCVICLVLYIYSFYFTPTYTLDGSIEHAIQAHNIVAICFIQTIIISLFCSDSLMQEEKLMEYNRRVAHLASVDPLTGLMNRRSAIEKFSDLIDEGRDEVPFISISMGDIDFFKNVNDTYGHEAGDVVLKELARCFEEEVKDIGLVCRWGGEEFLFILPGMNGDEAAEFMENIRRKVKTIPLRLNNEDVRVSMTFGLQEHDFRDSIDTTIDSADRKLYIGKSSGRDIVIF